MTVPGGDPLDDERVEGAVELGIDDLLELRPVTIDELADRSPLPSGGSAYQHRDGPVLVRVGGPSLLRELAIYLSRQSWAPTSRRFRD